MKPYEWQERQYLDRAKLVDRYQKLECIDECTVRNCWLVREAGSYLYHVGDPEGAGPDRANYKPLLNHFCQLFFLEY